MSRVPDLEADLMTATAVAELLAVPVGTVRSWTSRGELPVFRLGPRITRYSRAEVLAWLEARRVAAAAPDELAARREARLAKRGGR